MKRATHSHRRSVSVVARPPPTFEYIEQGPLEIPPGWEDHPPVSILETNAQLVRDYAMLCYNRLNGKASDEIGRIGQACAMLPKEESAGPDYAYYHIPGFGRASSIMAMVLLSCCRVWLQTVRGTGFAASSLDSLVLSALTEWRQHNAMLGPGGQPRGAVRVDRPPVVRRKAPPRKRR
jgi:hypothetical protein